MELYQLKGFVLTARKGNLTRAADELNLTQPALSSRIRALEEELEERLFDRRGRGLVLTSAGEILLGRAEQILELSRNAVHELSDLKDLKSGSLIIGTNDSNCLYLLPDLLTEFMKEYPGVKIQLSNSHSTEVARWVLEGTVEIGVVTLPVPDRALVSRKLYDREDVLIYPPGHALEFRGDIGPRDLESYPFLYLHRGSVSHGRLLEELQRDSFGPESIMQIGSLEVVKRYVELGLGISVVPGVNVEHEVAEGRLMARRLNWIPVNSVGVIRRKNAWLSPAARVFIERLAEYTRQG